MGARTDHRQQLLDRGRQEGRIPSTTSESVDTRASEKNTRITADTIFLQQGHKPRSEENKQFDPGGKGEKARLGKRL